MHFTPKHWAAAVAAIGAAAYWLRRHPAGASAAPSVEELDKEFGYKPGTHGSSKHPVTPPMEELTHPVQTIERVLREPRVGAGEGPPHPPTHKTADTLPGTAVPQEVLSRAPVTEPWERVPPPSGTATRTAGDAVRTAARAHEDDRDVLGMKITGHAGPGDAQALSQAEAKARAVNPRR